VNIVVLRFIVLVSVMILCMHLSACLWFYTTKFGPSYDTWVYRSGLQQESKERLYLFSLYWAIFTLVTVGYGDIHAYNNSK
jgi:hypothetical protein